MRSLFIIIICLLFPLLSLAEVKVIELKYRAGSELVEQVRVVLDENEKLSAVASHLVLVADGESLLAAEQLIKLLDKPQRNLLIQVRMTEALQTVGEEVSTAVHLTNKGGSAAAATGFRRGNSSTTQQQSLQLGEGGKGFIEVGREIPFTAQWSAVVGEATGYSETISYKNVATGFWVAPLKLFDDQVLLEIEPYVGSAEQSGRQAPPEIDYSRLRTRLQVPLGQWYPLGGQLSHQDKLSQAIISWRSSSGQADRQLQIRIDPSE